jgi:hypothetical protein
MNVAAGQMARPAIASNFTTAARENQHLPVPGAGCRVAWRGPGGAAAIRAAVGGFLNAK